MQGHVTFSGRLATLGKPRPSEAAAAAASPQASDAAQVESRSMSDPLVSVIRRITRGSLEDQPSGSVEDPAFRLGREALGRFGADPGQGYQQSPRAPASDEEFMLSGVLPGRPLAPYPDIGPSSAGQRQDQGQGQGPGQQQAGLPPSSMLLRRGISSQEAPLLQLLAQDVLQGMHQPAPIEPHFPAMQFPSSRGSPEQGSLQQSQWVPSQIAAQAASMQQFPALVLQAQAQQQQRQLQQGSGFPFSSPEFNTSSSSTGSMHSGQIPQLQSYPATEGPTRVSSWDMGSSRSGGSFSRRTRSQSLRSVSRSLVQGPGQGFAFGESQHQGQAFAAMPSCRATSLTHGHVGPLETAPQNSSPSLDPSSSSSPSPQGLPALGQALQEVIYRPPWHPEGSEQGFPPSVPSQQAWTSHLPQALDFSYGGQDMGPLAGLGGQQMSRRAVSADTEPGIYTLQITYTHA